MSIRSASSTASVTSWMAVLGLLAAQPVQAGRVAQVLAPGQVVVEAHGVGQVADPTLDLERVMGRVEAQDPGRAVTRLGEAEQHEDGRRLACPVLAQQAEDLAPPQLQVEAVDGGQVAVVLGQPAGDDGRGLVAVGAHRRP